VSQTKVTEQHALCLLEWKCHGRGNQPNGGKEHSILSELLLSWNTFTCYILVIFKLMPLNSDINDILKLVFNMWSLSKCTSAYNVILHINFQYIKKLHCKNAPFIIFIIIIKNLQFIMQHTLVILYFRLVQFVGSSRFVEIYTKLKLLWFSHFRVFYFLRIEMNASVRYVCMSACLCTSFKSRNTLYGFGWNMAWKVYSVVTKSILVHIEWLKSFLYVRAEIIFLLNFIKHTHIKNI
jgi:hypothetical protein